MDKITKSSDDYVNNIELYDKNIQIETFKPKITRDICSIYELSCIITELANHLSVMPSIEKYINDIEVQNIIEPCNLAYKLLRNGKFDAIIDRGSEKVTFSELYIDPFIYDIIESYLQQQEDIRYEKVLKPLDLVT